jgi:small subunit ribosomal protein S21
MMGVRIVLADKEPIGAALRRFKKLLERNGHTYGLRRHEAFHKPTQERRSKAFKKRFKARRATLLAQTAGEQPVASVVEAYKAFRKKTGKP